MNNAELQALKEKYVAAGAASPNNQFADRAENAEVWDADGKRMVDFAGGIGVLNVGHRHPKVVAAVKAQLDKLMHTCQTVMPYAPYVQLAEKLCKITPVTGDSAKACMFNAGAEALENAVKIARCATGRHGVICFDGGYHGRTLMTLAMTGKVAGYKFDFGPMPGGVFRAQYPIPYHGVSEEDSLKSLNMLFKTDIPPKDVAAIVIEAVQGEGGFYIAPPSFMQALRKLCDEHGIALIVDEVQSGFGRTGKMFAVEHSDVKPDIITMAKSMAGGMPISAVVGNAKMMDASGPTSLGGTYSGNPLSCASALAVMDIFEEENILEKSVALGKKLEQRFTQWQETFEHVDFVRNLGPMAAFELVKDKQSRQPDAEMAGALVKKCKEKGLILLSCGLWGNSIRVLMPITIQDEVLEEGLSIIEESLKELE
ncbi:4-aminobutyrate--2-oxoglutarate transaminase [Marinobacter fonticola]|uniref:4-aminobutyrate--2-oxoglutarate transaminase n=1 Tax=Marinobacter fonticola TaxID=2603215 RepID=UPI0011E7AEE7|nr:4-aminobutyrate--2-oxoglutarate transaminase [Marinobacter fonticola]